MTPSSKAYLFTGFVALALSAALPLHGDDSSLTRERSRTLRTFRVLRIALGDEPADKLPAATADAAAWDKAIAASTDAWKKAMKPQGLDFGDEAKILYDPDSETLGIYANPMAIQLLESYTEVLCCSAPRRMIFTLEVLEAPSAPMRELTVQAQPRTSHSAMLRELEALTARHEAKHIGTLRLETRSGHRSTMQSGPEQTFPRAFMRNEPGAVTALTESRSTGIKLTVDPVFGPDGWMMDLDYELEVQSAPPQRREVIAPPLGDSQIRKLPLYDFSVAHMASATTYNGDDTKLLGVWTPCQANGQPRHEAIQAAFLHMAPASSDGELNPLVEAKLREHLHRHGRIPAVDAEPELPVPAGKGLQRGRFKVPRSFALNVDPEVNPDQERALLLREDDGSFSLGRPPKPVQPGPVDPFAPQDADTGWIVTFPKGTDACYHSAKHVLEVVHTEEGLRKIEGFLDILWSKTPTLLAFSLHVVQGDESTLRELARESATKSDHTSTWAKIEELARDNKATVLSTQRIETRTGQRTSFMVGQERAAVGAFEKTERGTIEAKTGSKTIGTTWEVDPILSPDLRTIDINLSLEHHFAPLQSSPPDAAPTPDVGLDAEKVFAAKVQSAYTLQTGTTRLIGLWKPSGNPELDGKDVMQAAFLRADVVPVVDRENP